MLHTQKNPLVFFLQPKNSLASFVDPKKSLGLPIIKICEWGPWDKRPDLQIDTINLTIYCNLIHIYIHIYFQDAKQLQEGKEKKRKCTLNGSWEVGQSCQVGPPYLTTPKK